MPRLYDSTCAMALGFRLIYFMAITKSHFFVGPDARTDVMPSSQETRDDVRRKKEPHSDMDLAYISRDVVILSLNMFYMSFGHIPNLVLFLLKPKLI